MTCVDLCMLDRRRRWSHKHKLVIVAGAGRRGPQGRRSSAIAGSTGWSSLLYGADKNELCCQHCIGSFRHVRITAEPAHPAAPVIVEATAQSGLIRVVPPNSTSVRVDDQINEQVQR